MIFPQLSELQLQKQKLNQIRDQIESTVRLTEVGFQFVCHFIAINFILISTEVSFCL